MAIETRCDESGLPKLVCPLYAAALPSWGIPFSPSRLFVNVLFSQLSERCSECTQKNSYPAVPTAKLRPKNQEQTGGKVGLAKRQTGVLRKGRVFGRSKIGDRRSQSINLRSTGVSSPRHATAVIMNFSFSDRGLHRHHVLLLRK